MGTVMLLNIWLNFCDDITGQPSAAKTRNLTPIFFHGPNSFFTTQNVLGEF
jgi:hypothetical protein